MRKSFINLMISLFVAFSIYCCGRWIISSRALVGNVFPTVVSTYPLSNATNIYTNTKPTVRFDLEMDPSTLNSSTFNIKAGTNTLEGTVSYSGFTAIFSPKELLPSNTLLNARITKDAQSLINGSRGNGLEKDTVWSFTTGSEKDSTQPQVQSIFPQNGATDVSRNSQISVVFTELMDPSTINTSTFLVETGTSAVRGTVSYTGFVATFKANEVLASNTSYTVTLTNGAQDLASNVLNESVSWTFTTNSTQDTSAPTLSGIFPASQSKGVSQKATISASFSEFLDPSSMTSDSFLVKDSNSNAVAGQLSFLGTFAIFTPSTSLLPNAKYSVKILGSTNGVKDLAGNTMANSMEWTFETDSTVSSKTTISSNMPTSGSSNQCLQQTMSVTFNQAINGASVNPFTFRVTGPNSSAITCVLSYSSDMKTVTLHPLSNLPASSSMTVFVSGGVSGVQDLIGSPMDSNFLWVFTTGSSSCSSSLQ